MGTGGSLSWNVSCALHTILILSSCGIFVYKPETSIATKIVILPIFVFFYEIDEISCFLMRVCCFCARDCSNCIHQRGYCLSWVVLTWDYRSSDRNRFVDFCKRVEARNSRGAAGLRKPFFCHVIDVFVLMQFLNNLVDLCVWFSPSVFGEVYGALWSRVALQPPGCCLFYPWWPLLFLCPRFWDLWLSYS